MWGQLRKFPWLPWALKFFSNTLSYTFLIKCKKKKAQFISIQVAGFINQVTVLPITRYHIFKKWLHMKLDLDLQYSLFSSYCEMHQKTPLRWYYSLQYIYLFVSIILFLLFIYFSILYFHFIFLFYYYLNC